MNPFNRSNVKIIQIFFLTITRPGENINKYLFLLFTRIQIRKTKKVILNNATLSFLMKSDASPVIYLVLRVFNAKTTLLSQFRVQCFLLQNWINVSYYYLYPWWWVPFMSSNHPQIRTFFCCDNGKNKEKMDVNCQRICFNMQTK